MEHEREEGTTVKYYERLGMHRDPFSDDTDPALFFPTREHTGFLQRLEMSLGYPGGIHLVLGEPGVGKTIVRNIIHDRLAGRREDCLAFGYSSGDFSSGFLFLREVCRSLEIEATFRSVVECRNAIHDTLFRKVIEEGQTIALILDDGDRISTNGMGVLADLMNFRFGEIRLLHLVLFGRLELLERIHRRRAFDTCRNLQYVINTLDLDGLRDVVHHRLKVAGCEAGHTLFDERALREIWSFSRGNPREAIRMCRRSLESLAFRAGRIVGPETVRSVVDGNRDGGS
jgi:general secretion pathway protein A